MKISDLARSWSGMFIFVIVSVEKKKEGVVWVIQTATSAFGLGTGSVYTISSPLEMCLVLEDTVAPTDIHPARVPEQHRRSELSLYKTNAKGVAGNKGGTALPEMRRDKW